jgi:hypothetical protein
MYHGRPYRHAHVAPYYIQTLHHIRPSRGFMVPRFSAQPNQPQNSMGRQSRVGEARYHLYVLYASNVLPPQYSWLYLEPPLWSSGQSSWLQIQRSRVRFLVLPVF